MTRKKFKYTEAYIEYSNAVVPEFDSKGKPDLLGWDDAVASHQPNTDPIAKFYSKEYAEICKPVIEGFYKDIDLNEVYEADDVDIVWNEVWEAKPSLDIKWFWDEIICIDNGFNPDDHEWSAEEKDKDGNEYLWNEDGLFSQVPKYTDFVKSCQIHIENEMDFLKNPYDISQEEAIDNAVDEFSKILQLIVKYYY